MRWILLLLVVASALAVISTARMRHEGSRTTGPLAQSAYVWQRAWTADVSESAKQHGSAFESLVVLAAEVAWGSDRSEVACIHPDYSAIHRSGRPVGLALRVGPHPGSFSPADTQFLAGLAAEVIDEACAAGPIPVELQIDFDCATSKLAAYRSLIEAISARVAPTPVIITALPAWLASAEFAPLAREAGGFVLQVHSIERPKDRDATADLCDVRAAQRWVNLAAEIGVPFRVALPTYGYLVRYDSSGRLVGITAEAEAPECPVDGSIRELRADPAAMALLVRAWTADRPALLQGLVWYRLPMPEDRLNWSWPTLASVMRGSVPVPDLAVRTRRPEACLTELVAFNDGTADSPLPPSVTARWAGAALIGSDAQAGMDLVDAGSGSLRWVRPESLALERLRPGQERTIGWLRLSTPAEVGIDVQSPNP